MTERSATQIEKIQKTSRQHVYRLVSKHKQLGELAYEALKAGDQNNQSVLHLYKK